MAASSSSSAATQKIIRRANPSTIQDKFLVGYQGWFTCAGDGEPIGPGHHGWLHWFDKPIPDGGRPNLDLWPDVSSYDESELYPAPGLKLKNGEPAMLFSSRNAKTVQRHFHWMAEHGVDGAFLQRFAGQCDLEAGNEGIRRIRDEVGDRVREAAEREGRVFAIMYDVTGVPADRIERVLQQDWQHLLYNKRILDSPNYLKEKGKPVVSLWGFGFENAGHTPALVRNIANFFRNVTPGGVYLMAGTPTHWLTGEGDADRNPDFVNVWLNEFDAISPWTIGRFKTEDDADMFAEHRMKADADLIKHRNEQGRSRRIDYIPVVFPGGSGYHLSEGKWGLNDAPRKGGRFLWRQIFNARRNGARIIYGAMWDEYDEGTALMPVVANKRNLPVSDKWRFLSLDEGGHDVPSDWYMRICGFAAEVMRGERRIFDSFPSKELQDYWSTRPKYEVVPAKMAEFVSGTAGSSSSAGGGPNAASSSSAAGDDSGQSYEEWLASQRTDVEEAPPPPYTLEEDEAAASSTATASQAPISGSSSSSIAATTPAAASPTSPSTAAVAPGVAHQTPPTGPPPVNHQTHPNPHQAYSQATLPPGGPHSVSALANDFGRIGLNRTDTIPSSNTQAQSYPSGPSVPAGQGPSTVSSLYQPSRITTSPPPLHPNHPAAQGGGYAPTYGRPPSRPQTAQPASTPSAHTHHPSLQGRPPSAQPTSTPTNAWPHSQGQTQTQSQWPPTEWAPQSSHQVPSSTPPAGQYNHTGGANLSRPNTFSANSYVAAAANLLRPSGGTVNAPRPSSTLPYGTDAPPSAPTPSPASGYGSPAPGAPYDGAKPQMHHSSYVMPSGPSASAYPGMSSNPPSSSSYMPPQPSLPPPQSQGTLSGYGAPTPQPAGSYGFPVSSAGGPSASSYSPYTAPGGMPSFPSSSYPTAGVSGGPSPHTSPPMSPGGGSSGYPNHSPNSYSDMPGGSSAYGSNFAQQQQQPQQYPYGGAGGDTSNYFGNASMPAGTLQSSYPGSSSSTAGTQNDSAMAMPSSYNQAGGSASSPMPWQPQQGGTAGPQAPSLPPRPSNYAGGSYGSSSNAKPPGSSSGGGAFGFGPLSSTSGAAGSALGLALSAVDKVAGRKTKEQLESGIGSLAQSGSKLFGRFTK